MLLISKQSLQYFTLPGMICSIRQSGIDKIVKPFSLIDIKSTDAWNTSPINVKMMVLDFTLTCISLMRLHSRQYHWL